MVDKGRPTFAVVTGCSTDLVVLLGAVVLVERLVKPELVVYTVAAGAILVALSLVLGGGLLLVKRYEGTEEL